MYTGFWWGNLSKEGRLEDRGIDGKIISEWVSEKWDAVGMDWIDLAQNRDRWWAVVNAVMNLKVP
jgi:hypothetical protein